MSLNNNFIITSKCDKCACAVAESTPHSILVINDYLFGIYWSGDNDEDEYIDVLRNNFIYSLARGSRRARKINK